MPNKDGTGPNGEGPLTGRQQGNCKEGTGLNGQGFRRRNLRPGLRQRRGRNQ